MTNSTSTKRVTKRDHFNTLLAIPAVANDPALVEFIEHELDLLNRKNVTKDGEKKLTKVQEQNNVLKDDIVSYMEMGHLYTISELIKLVPSCADLSTPKVSSVVTQLVKAGTLKRTEDKRKAYFSLA